MSRLNAYEELIDNASEDGLTVVEDAIQASDGLCVGDCIIIREDIPTVVKKADVTAEEIGHNKYTVGDITDQTVVDNRKQENRARFYAYNLRIGLSGLLKAFKAGCRTTDDIADFLNVSEDFLLEALERYRQVYGTGAMVDNYYIRFEPYLSIQTYHFIM